LIHIIPVLRDNYCYILEGENKECLILDAGEAAPVEHYIHDHALKPMAILNTHHHNDHIGGNERLSQLYNIPIFAPQSEMQFIPNVYRGLSDGDILDLAGVSLKIIETPGHTLGHIVFYWEHEKVLFSGDTLFSMGCGRLFEGSAEDMFISFQKIKSLPIDTMVYCGHEYTLTNGFFGLSVEPDNVFIQARMDEVKKLRMEKKPTIPTSLETELKTNVFLMASSQKDFADLRVRKDNF
jgi:hydroxyacylglutathione hydrolase